MKRLFPKAKKDRFEGPLRHYHRAGAKPQRAWDAWIDEKSANAKSINWLKIIVIAIAVLALGGIIAGLIIEFF
ncbi:MAG: hypothetical protein NTV46_21630 [Verrucomicrobia bacterium]|nr:hypothetical protein [Verrucomicrobiota bacterium]